MAGEAGAIFNQDPMKEAQVSLAVPVSKNDEQTFSPFASLHLASCKDKPNSPRTGQVGRGEGAPFSEVQFNSCWDLLEDLPQISTGDTSHLVQF